jgi:hypothetical protein
MEQVIVKSIGHSAVISPYSQFHMSSKLTIICTAHEQNFPCDHGLISATQVKVIWSHLHIVEHLAAPSDDAELY